MNEWLKTTYDWNYDWNENEKRGSENEKQLNWNEHEKQLDEKQKNKIWSIIFLQLSINLLIQFQ